MSIEFKFNHDLNQYIADNNGRITTGNGSIYLPVKLKKGHTYKFDILFKKTNEWNQLLNLND